MKTVYARSLKGNDIRTALNVLRDEAALQGLYPPTKIAPTTPDGRFPYSGSQEPPLSRRERLARYLAADAKGDKAELRLVDHVTPTRLFHLPDTTFPLLMLHVMALAYINQQLEQAAMFMLARWRYLADGDADGTWTLVANTSAYRFRIGLEGWRQFAEGIGIDGDFLARGNYQGAILDVCAEPIRDLAPSTETMMVCLRHYGRPTEKLTTADDLAKGWRRMLREICDD